MRLSQTFVKTRKEAPRDEVARSAQLLLRAGYIHKELAGAYSYLPLGLKVLNNIISIIRKEMNALGAEELHLTALQPPEVWKKTGRWEDDVIDVWFKTKLSSGSPLGLGTTHEEPLTALVAEYVQSYRDLPRSVYQFQTKFRNELRARSGIMRTREFLMKDLYSFSRSEEEHQAFYERAQAAYQRIFERAGLGKVTHLTFASGGSFSKYSHEFQTVCAAGEDEIYVDQKSGIAVNREVLSGEVLADLKLRKDDLVKQAAVEVGNIFSLGTRFSEPLGLTFVDEQGAPAPVVMGSYGIGPGRLMGVIVEVLADQKGIVWPESIAPAQVQLISIGYEPEVKKAADDLYRELSQAGIETIYDDREESAGGKLNDADLMGMPVRVVVSSKTLEKKSAEIKRRTDDSLRMVALKDVPKLVQAG